MNDFQGQVSGVKVFLVPEQLEVGFMRFGEGDAAFLGELHHAGFPFHGGVGVQFNGRALHQGKAVIGIFPVHLLHFPIGDVIETGELKSVKKDGRVGLGNDHP